MNISIASIILSLKVAWKSGFLTITLPKKIDFMTMRRLLIENDDGKILGRAVEIANEITDTTLSIPMPQKADTVEIFAFDGRVRSKCFKL